MLPMFRSAAILAGLLFTAPPSQGMTPSDSFESLKPLAGRWVGTSSAGTKLDITYRLIANDTVLVESWKSPSGRETMTVYHKDGDDLIATHYCAQGNQPRLRLSGSNEGGRFEFIYRDATNLMSNADPHLHRFWIEPEGNQTLKRSETYTHNGAASEERAVLMRVAPDNGSI